MKLEKITGDFYHVSMNFTLFKVEIYKKNEHIKYVFPIKKIKSFDNGTAQEFYKAITRTIDPKRYLNEQ